MIMVTIRMMMTMMTWAVDTSVEKLLPLSRQFVGNLLFPGTPSYCQDHDDDDAEFDTSLIFQLN